ncbi:unnamed protein product [Lota lota]
MFATPFDPSSVRLSTGGPGGRHPPGPKCGQRLKRDCRAAAGMFLRTISEPTPRCIFIEPDVCSPLHSWRFSRPSADVTEDVDVADAHCF